MIRRSSNLTEERKAKILGYIESFSVKISWGLLIRMIESEVGERYTEQGLRKHRQIADAYRFKKVILSKQMEFQVNRGVLSSDAKTIIDLKAENFMLRKINQQLLEKFSVWAHNAVGNGLTEEILNKSVEI